MNIFKIKNRYLAILLAIMAIAAFFRFYQLADIPPGLYPDVAMNGNNGISAVETGDFKVFYPENNGREGLFINFQALSMMLFGVNVWALKAVAAFIGTLTVLGLYLLAKELFHNLYPKPYTLNPDYIALLSSFFLAVSFWHVNFSRIGFRAIMIPLVMVFSFYFLYRALRTEQATDFIAAGIFFGLGSHTYISFRIAPLILLTPLIFEAIKYWNGKKEELKTLVKSGWQKSAKKIYIENYWLKWDIFFLVITLTTLPLIIYFVVNPQDFIGRAGQVSIFNSEAPLKDLIFSTVKTLAQFNFTGDYNWRHNYSGSPQLFWPVGILFLIGLIISLKEIFKKENYRDRNYSSITGYWLLITWLFIMLVPSFLSSEGIPHALRSIGAIPPAMIFAGLGGVWLYNKLKTQNPKLKTQLLVISYLLLVFIAFSEYNKYFNDWAKRPETKASFNEYYVKIGDFLNALPTDVNKYVLVNAGGVLVKGIPMPSQTIQFITHRKSKVSYLVPKDKTAVYTIVKDNSVLTPLEPDEKLLNQLKTYLPKGIIKTELGIEYFEFKSQETSKPR